MVELADGSLVTGPAHRGTPERLAADLMNAPVDVAGAFSFCYAPQPLDWWVHSQDALMQQEKQEERPWILGSCVR